jgi:hypothetical protein
VDEVPTPVSGKKTKTPKSLPVSTVHDQTPVRNKKLKTSTPIINSSKASKKKQQQQLPSVTKSVPKPKKLEYKLRKRSV